MSLSSYLSLLIFRQLSTAEQSQNLASGGSVVLRLQSHSAMLV